MDWVQTISIIVTVIASAFYIHREVHEDINAANARADIQSQRIDQLYNMFVDLLKEGRK